MMTEELDVCTFDKLLSSYGELFDREFYSDYWGKYILIGISYHNSGGWYFTMMNTKDVYNIKFFSCVGSLETYGFTIIKEKEEYPYDQ
jgi:hypothetical protein